MLEAVNSSVSNAPLIRGNVEQTSSTRSFAANPAKVQEVPQAPFISPYIHFDSGSKTAVLALRDSQTGDFLTTIPSDAKLDARAREAASRARAEQAASAYIRSDAPQQQQDAVQQQAAPQPTAPVKADSSAFGAFTKQVAALQNAIVGGGTGGTVSTFA